MKTYFYAFDCFMKQSMYMQEYFKMSYYIGNDSKQQAELLEKLNNALINSTTKLIDGVIK